MNGETNLDTKALPTPKLKKLQSPKSRLKQALLGSITTPNFTQIRWTVMENGVENVSTHICTFSGDVLYPLPSFRTHNSSLEGAMELKFAPFWSS